MASEPAKPKLRAVEPPVTFNTLAKALIEASKKFKPVVKDSKNPHYGNTYASLGAYIEATKDALADQGLAVVQRAFVEGAEQFLETLIVHESGETFQAGVFPIRPVKNDPQGVGSAMTYARRYSYAAALNLASEDDDGNEGSKPEPKKEDPRPEAKEPPHVAEAMTAARKRWGGKEGMTYGRIKTHLDALARGLKADSLAALAPEHIGALLDLIANGSDPA